MSPKNPKVWIKPKVLFGFLIVLGIAFAASYVTYEGFIALSETKESLSEPSRKLIKLNSILTDIYEAESNIRTYTLTQNENYLTLYFSFLLNINEKVDTLLILTYDDPVQSGKILYVQELLARKIRVLNELMELKKEDQFSQFYYLALKEVEKIEFDTTTRASVITSTTTTTTSQHDTIVSRVPDETTQGVFSRMKRWFSKTEIIDTTITKRLVEVETKVDTLKIGVVSLSDSLLTEVVKILTSIKDQQQEAFYNVSSKELELLRSDKQIMDQIRTIVSLLEKEELLNSFKRAEEIREVVKNSTESLLILGGTAFFLVLLFTVLIFRDISNANFYRNQLLASKKYAEKLLKIKEEFLANMSHEIRTPLSTIIGFARQLKRTELQSDQQMFVNSLHSSSQHLLQIVNDILDLSKIEAGYIQFESIPFSPFDVSKEAVDTFSLKAKEKGISIHIHSQQDTKPIVLGDPFRLKQILYNLVSNAVKFTSEGGIILLINQENPSDNIVKFTFEVNDTGIGIDPAKIDAIFEQFSQVDSSTSRMYGGTGLGLTIVKKLTELQGGKVEVNSELNKGTTFKIQIEYPLSTGTSLTPSTYDPLKGIKLPESLKILVVDDDPISQLLVSEMFKTLGITATVLGDPYAAVEVSKSNNFNIIFSDIQMPGMSGFDLVTKIKENSSAQNNPMVIALTANSTVDDIKFYHEAGFDGVLIKPFDELDLYNSIAPYTNQEQIKNPEKEKNLENQVPKDYDISDIYRFAGGDKESAKVIIQSFIDNSNINLEILNQLVREGDWRGVGEVSHRMKSAFRQLKVQSLGDALQSLEEISTQGVNGVNVNDTINFIETEISRVQDLLRCDMENL
jgi:hypothetical protein